jgi:hypothetical protein
VHLPYIAVVPGLQLACNPDATSYNLLATHLHPWPPMAAHVVQSIRRWPEMHHRAKIRVWKKILPMLEVCLRFVAASR